MKNQILILVYAFLTRYEGFSQKPQNVASNKIYKNLVVTDRQTICTSFPPTISVTQPFPLSIAIQYKNLHRIHAVKRIIDIKKQALSWNTVLALPVGIPAAVSQRI
jgi:hypothetical protein